MKTRYQLLIIAFVFSALGGIGYALHHNGYESGKFDTNQAWNIKWAERDGKDLLELAGRQEQERTEEQRRQNEINQVTADAQTQLDKARLDAAHAEHSADQFSSPSQTSGVSSQQVKPASFPQLPTQARQGPTPEYCLPTCSANLSNEISNWQQLLTNGE